MYNYFFSPVAKIIVYGTTILALGGAGTGIMLSKRTNTSPAKLEIKAQELQKPEQVQQTKPTGVKSNDNENCTANWPLIEPYK